MKTKTLFLIAFIVAIASFWLLKEQNSIEPKLPKTEAEVDYEATEIEAVQTNKLGETEYVVKAESIRHNINTNKDELVNIEMDWYVSADNAYHLTADAAVLNQQTGDIQLLDNFVMTKGIKGSDDYISITGNMLNGNTKSKAVYSNNPMDIEQGDNTFTAKSMTADLTVGEYVFNNIEMLYQPTERVDKDLF